MVTTQIDVSAQIRRRLDQLDRSYRNLAGDLGVYPDTVKRWLHGMNSPRLEMLVPISQVLGTTVEWLVSDPEASELPAPPAERVRVDLTDAPRLMIEERMNEQMDRSGITIHQIAGDMEIDPETVRAWRLGRRNPTPEMLPRLAAALGVSVDWLVSGLAR